MTAGRAASIAPRAKRRIPRRWYLIGALLFGLGVGVVVEIVALDILLMALIFLPLEVLLWASWGSACRSKKKDRDATDGP